MKGSSIRAFGGPLSEGPFNFCGGGPFLRRGPLFKDLSTARGELLSGGGGPLSVKGSSFQKFRAFELSNLKRKGPPPIVSEGAPFIFELKV